ncbi:MAG TPA: bifunctional diguanylate cyclase/phosphodiesterase [Gemmatimonadaceae bacterium]|nr:bifunctional diguanylate cyclase/phosphodiesterase [Gemmatimonadaceae bacterium]
MSADGTDALHDPQTELANRELFLDRLQMSVLRSARYKDRKFAVLSISVRQYDRIAGAHGFQATSAVLHEFAQRLKGVVRNYDSIGHIGGDHFAVLLESIRDVSDPARVANRLHEALRSTIHTPAAEFIVSACVGIALNDPSVDSAERLMQLAGLARQRAANSDAAYEIYDPVMQEHARARLQKETELRRALDEGQFDLHYQPIVALDTGRIVKTEALMRWRHPERGLVAAGEFISLAEETGLAVPMGWFALDLASRQLASWRSDRASPVSVGMSINFTAAHFHIPDMAEQVRDVLAKHSVADGMNFEVTERLLIGDPARTKDTLNKLRALGVGIHLDDFGTGYSSLQYLHDLPFDAIKIDRSFIARLPKGGRDAQLVSTIRELARNLGVPVIAEGVETDHHLSLVRALGCEYAQGYLFAKALPAADFASLVTRNPSW